MPDHAPARRSPGWLVAVLLLCAAALAGCGAEEPPFARVAYCMGASSDQPDGTPIDLEFRQGSTVVAGGSVSVGEVFTAEVPLGGVRIYVDDVAVGSVNEGIPTDGATHSPAPEEISYLRSPEGCPDSAYP